MAIASAYDPLDRANYRSDEEWYYAHWLTEMQREKFVSRWEYEPKTYQLIPAYKELGLRPTTYTPDFFVWFTTKGKKRFNYRFPKDKQEPLVVDIKGKFQRQQNDFPIKQKLLYMIHGIYTHKIVIPDLFQEFFAPEEYFYTPKKRTKRQLLLKRIGEWLKT